MTTLQRTIRPGAVVSAGSEGAYRRLAYGPGEPRIVRDELAGTRAGAATGGGLAGAKPGSVPGRRLVPVVNLGHLTDIQLADVQSPGRFEFFERLRGRPGAGSYVPAWRPQEALAAQAVAAMVAAVNGLPSSAETGASVGLCISTGDNLDNAQLNELEWVLALLGGGRVCTQSGGPAYEGTQAPGWQPAAYWCPEPGPDPFKERFGFPAYPGLLREALELFESPGLAMPWLSCFGNHDGLVLGTALPTPAYEKILSGGHKPADLPAGINPLEMVEAFTSNPEVLLGGPAREVVPGPGRTSVGRQQFVEAHLRAGGIPRGHGFDRRNVEDGTAYGVFDVEAAVPLRVVVLDTANMDGYYEGSIGARQSRWLEEKLSEVHSHHFDRSGRRVTTGAADRLVLLASHHGLDAMVNQRQDPAGFEQDHPRVTAGELEAMLHRFPNVVLWLNGHRHHNSIRARPGPAGWRGPTEQPGGFWEVSTAAIADWPCQARLVEVVMNGENEVDILCTMLDSGAPPGPEEAEGADRLASLHREIASNDPYWDHVAEGSEEDRNVSLRLPAPFSVG